MLSSALLGFALGVRCIVIIPFGSSRGRHGHPGDETHVRLFAALLASAAGDATAQTQGNQSRRPNIILILADDLGYETIGANGGTSYRTPAIDRLAANGMRFENAYAHPLCTPSRVALMTGQYNSRNYTSFGELRLGEKTFGTMLRDAGYKTRMVGKWQLSERDFQAPHHFGFDEYLLWHFGTRVNGVQTPGPRFAYWDPVVYDNGTLLADTSGEFGPDPMAESVAEFIQQHQAEPFFLDYSLVLPHDPWIEPPGYLPTGRGADRFPSEIRPGPGVKPGLRRRKNDNGALPRWSSTWTRWSGA